MASVTGGNALARTSGVRYKSGRVPAPMPPGRPRLRGSGLPRVRIAHLRNASSMAAIPAWKLRREVHRVCRQLATSLTGGRFGTRPDHEGFTHPPAVPASLSTTTRPRCAVVAMVRNQADQAHAVMRHFCALFDTVVVIDRRSTDDTGRIVAGYDGHAGTTVITLRTNEADHLQSASVTACARAIVAQAAADWVFFLDFDEFLPFVSRREFHQALVQFVHTDVIHGHWLNCVPQDLSRPVTNGIEVVTADEVSRSVKVAINARRLRGRTVSVQRGNHAVTFDADTTPRIGERAYGVLHFPVVSAAVLARKLRDGVTVHDATQGGTATDGFHWREMLRRIDALHEDAALLTEIALRDGEPAEQVVRDYVSGPATRVRRRPLHACFAQVWPAEPTSHPAPPEVSCDAIERVLCDHLAARRAGRPAAGRAPVQAVYRRLPASGDRPGSSDADGWIMRAIVAGAQQLEFVVPSAWAGHEAFLLTLMEAMRPRRYVELGTHAGESFFTACQHYASQGDYGEAVAVDLWEGDHQTGFYGESVFRNFREILARHYPGCGRYIRGSFAEAAGMFEPQSIDLLHIDGLHTYDAVREDYVTWRPKLTDHGVVMFHDTGEFQSDFGVWQLFDELKSEATASFNFRHGHGLGVLAFGDAAGSPAVRLLRLFNEDPALFESHYAVLGRAIHQASHLHARSLRRKAA